MKVKSFAIPSCDTRKELTFADMVKIHALRNALRAEEECGLSEQEMFPREHEEDLSLYVCGGFCKKPLLTRDEEKRLVNRIRKGDESAVTEFLERNIGLALVFARAYGNRGLDFPDLVQECLLGCVTAIRKFNPYAFGTKFSTYGWWWIRQGATKAISTYGRLIRIPQHAQELMSRYRKAFDELYSKNEGVVLDEDIARSASISLAWVRRVKEIGKYQKIISLDASADPLDGGDTTVAEVIPDRQAEDPSVVADESHLQESITRALALLTPRERAIIIKRFGLFGEKKEALEDIARAYKITRERIRQIEGKALRKLRHSSRKRYLTGFGYGKEEYCKGRWRRNGAWLEDSPQLVPEYASARPILVAVAEHFSVTIGDIRRRPADELTERARTIAAYLLYRDAKFAISDVLLIILSGQEKVKEYVRKVSVSFRNGRTYDKDIQCIRACVRTRTSRK